MDDGILVEEIHGGHDPVLEFLFGCDADVAQHRTGEFGEEAFDQIEHQEPWVGVKVSSKRPAGWAASQALVSLETWAE